MGTIELGIPERHSETLLGAPGSVWGWALGTPGIWGWALQQSRSFWSRETLGQLGTLGWAFQGRESLGVDRARRRVPGEEKS